ncbi:MAG TPA: cob(I)yrinic acid a,c-diamide adenosyltransferase [Anaerolineaceae bacterium]|nr:cob(I)yrinic acid a,c-diamide adenosyltransferase [Anaerolineaceae bacterium]
MTKYYTGKGDSGDTGLLGDGRVPKFDLRMECLGTLDELSAALGLARSLLPSKKHEALIVNLQRRLYELMAEVAATADNAERFSHINTESVTEIEKQIDSLAFDLESPEGFIIPGDTTASAAVSCSRTIARRAERRVVELAEMGGIRNKELLAYLNRLSSLLFVLELKLIQESRGSHVTYAKGKPE